MLSIRGMLSRRELLTVGSVGLAGLGLPDFLHRQAQAAPARSKAESVIFLYLQGSPSHIDTWDPKPDAPVDIRGEFKPIATTAPGMQLSEVLPMLAQQARHFALVRSLGVKPKGLSNHGASIYMLLTAHDPNNFTPTGLAVPPSREDLPSFGSVIARYRPAEQGSLSYAALCFPVREGAVSGVGQGAGLLGGTYDPFPLYEDPSGGIRAEAFTLPPDTTLGRLQARIELRSSLAARSGLGPKAFDGYYGKALSLIASARAQKAFRLEEEEQKQRERY